jgi:hypothetical protein
MEDGNPTNIAYLLPYLVDNLMQDQRKEMFIMEDNVYVKSKLFDWNTRLTKTTDGQVSSS